MANDEITALAVPVGDAGAMLGMRLHSVEKLILAGEIACFKIGKGGRSSKKLIPVESIHAYVQRQIAAAEAERQHGGADLATTH